MVDEEKSDSESNPTEIRPTLRRVRTCQCQIHTIYSAINECYLTTQQTRRKQGSVSYKLYKFTRIHPLVFLLTFLQLAYFRMIVN